MNHHRPLPNETAGDYMARRYEEAKAQITESLKDVGREVDPFLALYLSTLYYHGVQTGIEGLYLNQTRDRSETTSAPSVESTIENEIPATGLNP